MNSAAARVAANNADKKAMFKNWTPFTSCISWINNVQINNAQYIDVIMPMHNLIECSDNYLKASGILWQYCKIVLAVNNGETITDFI